MTKLAFKTIHSEVLRKATFIMNFFERETGIMLSNIHLKRHRKTIKNKSQGC